MVDSRQKGARAETVIRDLLRDYTDLNWERVPSSGALDPKHGLKGDLYIPNEKNLYCVEVKHYADDQVSSSILTAKQPILLDWWEQALRQGTQVSKIPLLIFKYDRSKVFCAFKGPVTHDYQHIFISAKGLKFYVCLLEDLLLHETVEFIA